MNGLLHRLLVIFTQSLYGIECPHDSLVHNLWQPSDVARILTGRKNVT